MRKQGERLPGGKKSPLWGRLAAALLCLCLLFTLLPATALAAAPSGQVLYAGGVQISSTGYWTTDSEGNVTAYSGTGTPAGNYIHYDADNNILTLHNATIKKALDYGNSSPNSLISGAAIGVLNQSGNAALTIQLEGDNTIEDVSTGIYVLALSSSTGAASLTITGENGGSLNASGSRNSGIWVQSNSGDATLTIKNAEVTATSEYGSGVWVQADDSSDASLSVDGGSLTATGNSNYGAGIQYTFGSSSSGSGTPSLTVNGNAIVKASGRAGGITSNSSPVTPSGTGIVLNNGTGTVYENVTLQENLEIGEDESLTLSTGASLDANGNNVIVDGGALDSTLATSLGGSVKYTPTITTASPLSNGTVGTYYEQTLAADGTAPVTWSVSNGTLPAGLSLNASTGEISGTPTAQGANTFTVTATNAYGSDSRQLAITITIPATIPVTGVTLDKSSLTLAEGGTAQLTAAVKPDNASNKAVTWESGDTSVATVDTNGKVTAVGAGTATITATTQDGGKTATCVVTVTAQTYNISATPALLNFGAVTGGYAAAPAAQTVTITNTGNQSVTVNLPTSTNYTIAAGTGFTGGTAALAPNAAAEFTVRPKTGLGAGKYGETLTISGSGGASAKVTLSFAVNAAGTPGAGQGGPKQNPPTGVGLPMPPDGSGGHAGQGGRPGAAGPPGRGRAVCSRRTAPQKGQTGPGPYRQAVMARGGQRRAAAFAFAPFGAQSRLPRPRLRPPRLVQPAGKAAAACAARACGLPNRGKSPAIRKKDCRAFCMRRAPKRPGPSRAPACAGAAFGLICFSWLSHFLF